MEITVHFTTQLRAALGTGTQIVCLPVDATVTTLIERLAALHPQTFRELVLDARGQLLPNLIVCVNDRQVSRPQEFGLRPGNQVLLLSAISGG